MAYNDEPYVAEAIRTLLEQTYRDFTLWVVDDGSTDGTWSVVRALADGDPRVRAVRNEKRLGMSENYRKTFWLSGGETEFWAWAAGHDRHHPGWLEAMVRALDDHPDAVMAYPLTVRISETGERYADHPPPRFETVGMGPGPRIAAMRTGRYRMGDMIYGLFRTEALRLAGIFPRTLLPDVLLLWRLARHGTVVQVPEELWHRRFVGLFSIERQRRALFPGRPPWYAYLPWPLVNAAALVGASALRSGGGGPWAGLRWAGAFLSRYWPYLFLSSRWLSRILDRPVQAYLRWKRRGHDVSPADGPRFS